MRIAPTTAHLIATPVCVGVSHYGVFFSFLLLEVAIAMSHCRIAPHVIVVVVVVVEAGGCLSLFQYEPHRCWLYLL